MEGLFRRRRLPHWDVEDGTYFVTTCLEGSIPAEGLIDLFKYRDEVINRPKPAEVDVEEWELRQHKLVFARLDEWLDCRSAVRHLADPRMAAIVRDALYHFAGERYDLLAFAVMSSHFHWLFRPTAAYCRTLKKGESARQSIMKSIKGYTAYRCNQILESSGTFWQDESYDHVVRGDDELARIIAYIENNPVKANLTLLPENWLWSSAHDRAKRTVVAGEWAIR